MRPSTNPVMTPEQQAAHVAMVKEVTERHNDKMRPQQELYDERCKLWRMSCDIPLRDLKRLNDLLRRLSHDDLKRAVAFAEGLAEWSESASESPDAQSADR